MNNQTTPVKDERLWIKVGNEFIKEIDRSILSEDVFDVDFDGAYLVQITNDNGEFKATNAVNGYGNNVMNDFINLPVTFLTQHYPSTKAGYASSTPSEQGSDGWISVGDRLPEDVGIYEVKRVYTDNPELGEFSVTGFTNYHGYRVTHWKPKTPPQSKE